MKKRSTQNVTDRILETNNVFVDTSVFRQKLFNVECKSLKALRVLVESREITFFTTSITRREIDVGIEKLLDDALAAHRRLRREGRVLFATGDKQHADLLRPLDKSSLSEALSGRFAGYLKAVSAVDVPISKVPSSVVFERYFSAAAPFEQREKKKHEFPDAFVLLALEKWCAENHQAMYVLSADAGMEAYCRTSSWLHCLPSIEDFLDLYKRHRQNVPSLPRWWFAPVILDGRMLAGEVNRRLAASSIRVPVLIRRQSGIDVYWYAFTRYDLQGYLHDADENVCLQDLLHLTRLLPLPTVGLDEFFRQAFDRKGQEAFFDDERTRLTQYADGAELILDGNEVVALRDPEIGVCRCNRVFGALESVNEAYVTEHANFESCETCEVLDDDSNLLGHKDTYEREGLAVIVLCDPGRSYALKKTAIERVESQDGWVLTVIVEQVLVYSKTGQEKSQTVVATMIHEFPDGSLAKLVTKKKFAQERTPLEDRLAPTEKPKMTVIVCRGFRKPVRTGWRLAVLRARQWLRGWLLEIAEREIAVTKEFSPYPALDAPTIVAPEQLFDLTVGLSEGRRPGTEPDGPLAIPIPESLEEFDIDVEVICADFTAPEGNRRTFKVRGRCLQECGVRIQLQAKETLEPIHLSSIVVHYYHSGTLCGTAWHNIAIVKSHPQRSYFQDGEASWNMQPHCARLRVAPDDSVPDLTIMISKADGNSATGQYNIAFTTPHSVQLPPSVLLDFGENATGFVAHILGETDALSQETPLADDFARAVGQALSDVIPAEFWLAIRKIANVVQETDGRAPSLILASSETVIPWELAFMADPIDPRSPPYLGAQVAMGRWILGASAPPPPTENTIQVEEIAAISSSYEGHRREPKVPAALQEVQELVRNFLAIPIPGTEENWANLLDAQVQDKGLFIGGVEIVHCAGHGRTKPSCSQDQVLDIGHSAILSPLMLRSSRLARSHRPFLFLNACESGLCSELLGECSGFAGQALKAGFRGFLAPLWAVDDRGACSAALSFYEATFGGTRVPEALRNIRAQLAATTGTRGGLTPLAYMYFGHPRLRLVRIPSAKRSQAHKVRCRTWNVLRATVHAVGYFTFFSTWHLRSWLVRRRVRHALVKYDR
ncbi:MAG: DUF4935 domain-containing protein [Kiritimatiellae bacterium]|nr:DUF4935 domain-containing protein [Kiritimatiellia bacterium]